MGTIGHPVKGWMLGIVIGFEPELGNLVRIKGIGGFCSRTGYCQKARGNSSIEHPSFHLADKRARWEPELSLEKQEESLTGEDNIWSFL